MSIRKDGEGKSLLVMKELYKRKGIIESITLTKEDLKLLREKGRLYADGELKGKLIEVVYNE